jgi:hypothetical protein
MGISSLKGIGSSRRSFISTATSQSSTQIIILQVTGAGTLKSFYNNLSGQSYTVKIIIDGQPFTTDFLHSQSYLTGILTSAERTVSYASCDLSFTESLKIELISGYFSFQFKYHLELEV